MEHVIAFILDEPITALDFIIITNAIPICIRRYRNRTLEWYHIAFIVSCTISFIRGITEIL